jgi:lincosamide nucleotidyltransferase A/C/D/E
VPVPSGPVFRQNVAVFSAEDVLDLYAQFSRAGVHCWVVGGWGVDALLRRQTREHHDLDLLVRDADLGTILELLADRGYALKLLWPRENTWISDPDSDDHWPTAFVLADGSDREVDIHVVQLTAAGEVLPLWETEIHLDRADLAGQGRIGGTSVACFTADMQLRAHSGYDLPDSHAADIKKLLEMLG